MSLSLVSVKSAFLHDGYIAAIENYCMPMVVKHILFTKHVAILLLGTSFNPIFDMHIMSLLLGASFHIKLLQKFILEHYS